MSEPASKHTLTEPGEPTAAEAADEKEKEVAVRSAEGEVLHWPRQVALRAGTLKDWIEDTGGEGEYPTGLLSTKILETLLAACAHDGGDATSPIASLPLEEATDLLFGAHFLDATAVFVAAARHLCGTLLAGKSVDELRSALSAPNDLTAHQQKAAALEPIHMPPTGLGAEEVTAVADTSLSAPPAMQRSLSTRAGNEDVLVLALQVADTTLLCRLKAVSQVWRTRARNELCSRVSCRGAGKQAPSSLDEIVELDVELLSAAGRAHEAVAAAVQLPSLARLRGWGFVVDMQKVRQADLSGIEEESEGYDDDENFKLTVTRVLHRFTEGEGEPPIELLLVAVACAVSGEVLRVPVQQLREGNLVELDLSMQHVGVGGVWLLALLLPMCSKLVRLK
jgi:hypothetical protein